MNKELPLPALSKAVPASRYCTQTDVTFRGHTVPGEWGGGCSGLRVDPALGVGFHTKRLLFTAARKTHQISFKNSLFF